MVEGEEGGGGVGRVEVGLINEARPVASAHRRLNDGVMVVEVGFRV